VVSLHALCGGAGSYVALLVVVATDFRKAAKGSGLAPALPGDHHPTAGGPHLQPLDVVRQKKGPPMVASG